MPIIFDGSGFKTVMGKELTKEEAIAWSDTARNKKIPNLPDYAAGRDNINKIMRLLTDAYEILGCDAYITSFYRGSKLNAEIGGSINPPSAHMDLRAVDSIPIGRDLRECYEQLQEHATILQYDQLIIEHDALGRAWLHMSVSKMLTAARLQALDLKKTATTTTRKQQG